MLAFFRRRLRERLRRAPSPDHWPALLRRNVPLYNAMPATDRAELEAHARVLIAEKHFEGCDGFVMTDEVRVTIAALASVLLLRRETDYYPWVDTVLVYPAAFVTPVVELNDYGIVTESEEVRLGETGTDGTLIVSWDDILYDTRHPRDGVNLVLHEFAHQLDAEGGDIGGVPELESHADYERWVHVLGEAYDKLQSTRERGRRSVLDEYGATDAAEFFAVATECFFEKPRELSRRHGELYRQLADYYRQDPAREHRAY